MGASVLGILLLLLAALGLAVWGLVWLFGGIVTMVIGFALVCILMMLIILIQKPRGGGLSGAFGGAGGGSQAAFGAKTGDVLTLATIVFFICYMGLAMGLTWGTRYGDTALEPPQTDQPVDGEAPGESATPSDGADDTAEPEGTTTPGPEPDSGAKPEPQSDAGEAENDS